LKKISNSFQPSCFKAALGIVKEERKKGGKDRAGVPGKDRAGVPGKEERIAKT